jgi:hypothetical protein
MFPRLCHPETRFCRSHRETGKLRPASHSYLPQREPLVVATIFSLGALLVYAGAWLVRLLGDLPLSHP